MDRHDRHDQHHRRAALQVGTPRRVLQLHLLHPGPERHALRRTGGCPAAAGLAGRRAGAHGVCCPRQAGAGGADGRRPPGADATATRAAGRALRRQRRDRQRHRRRRGHGLHRLHDPWRRLCPRAAGRPPDDRAPGRPHAAAAVRDRGLPHDGPAGAAAGARAVVAAAGHRTPAGRPDRAHRRRRQRQPRPGRGAAARPDGPAAEIESALSGSQSRLGASRAYHALVTPPASPSCASSASRACRPSTNS